MNRKTTTRILSAAIVLLMTLALAVPALAVTTYVIATDDTTVRKGPSTSYSSLGTLEEGEAARKLGTAGVWTKIDFDGEDGYVKTADVDTYSGDDLIIIDNSSSSSSTAMYVTALVNVRSGPGTNYSKVGELKKGDTVSKVGVTGGWTIINWGSKGTAYVSSSYLTTSGSGSTTTGTTMVTTANVNVRTGPGTSYSLLGYLTKGTKVTKTGVSGNWTIINYNGKVAYVSSAYLAVSSGGTTTSDTLLYAMDDDTPVRQGPGKSYRAIGYLDEGDTVKYLGTSGSSWYKVQFGSNIAYVYADDMWFKSTGSSSTSSGLVYASSSVRVYEQPSTTSEMLGYLYAGETATRTGKLSSGWTRIEYEGDTAYVQTARVTVISGADSSGSMSTLNKWMYAIDDYTYCYSVPSATSSYRKGYLDEDERVWALAGNSTWTKVLVDDTIYYVKTADLTSSGYYYDDEDDGDYSIGSRVYPAKYSGAPTYANTARTPYKVSDEDTAYGKISRGTALTVKGQVGSLLLVSWRDDRDEHNTGKTLTAYVDLSLVTSVRP